MEEPNNKTNDNNNNNKMNLNTLTLDIDFKTSTNLFSYSALNNNNDQTFDIDSPFSPEIPNTTTTSNHSTYHLVKAHNSTSMFPKDSLLLVVKNTKSLLYGYLLNSSSKFSTLTDLTNIDLANLDSFWFDKTNVHVIQSFNSINLNANDSNIYKDVYFDELTQNLIHSILATQTSLQNNLNDDKIDCYWGIKSIDLINYPNLFNDNNEFYQQGNTNYLYNLLTNQTKSTTINKKRQEEGSLLSPITKTNSSLNLTKNSNNNFNKENIIIDLDNISIDKLTNVICTLLNSFKDVSNYEGNLKRLEELLVCMDYLFTFMDKSNNNTNKEINEKITIVKNKPVIRALYSELIMDIMRLLVLIRMQCCLFRNPNLKKITKNVIHMVKTNVVCLVNQMHETNIINTTNITIDNQGYEININNNTTSVNCRGFIYKFQIIETRLKTETIYKEIRAIVSEMQSIVTKDKPNQTNNNQYCLKKANNMLLLTNKIIEKSGIYMEIIKKLQNINININKVRAHVNKCLEELALNICELAIKMQDTNPANYFFVSNSNDGNHINSLEEIVCKIKHNIDGVFYTTKFVFDYLDDTQLIMCNDKMTRLLIGCMDGMKHNNNSNNLDNSTPNNEFIYNIFEIYTMFEFLFVDDIHDYSTNVSNLDNSNNNVGTCSSVVSMSSSTRSSNMNDNINYSRSLSSPIVQNSNLNKKHSENRLKNFVSISSATRHNFERRPTNADLHNSNNNDYLFNSTNSLRKPSTSTTVFTSTSSTLNNNVLLSPLNNKHYVNNRKLSDAWYLESDYGSDQIIFMNNINNNSNNNLTVKAGTLSALIERLTYHDNIDPTFVQTFLLTYQTFTTTNEFIDLLISSRYYIEPYKGLNREQLKKWTEYKQKPIRLRVCNVLKNWIDNFANTNSQTDLEILNKLNKFAKNIRNDDNMKMPSDLILKAIQKKTNQNNNNEESNNNTNNINLMEPPASILPRNLTKFKLLDLSPLEIARHLSMLEFDLYSKIKPSDLLNKAWSQQNDKNSGINVKNMIYWSNRLTNWTAHTILSAKDTKKRCSLIKHFILISEKCYELNNFSSLIAILAAFSVGAILRLKRTWELMHGKWMVALDKLKNITSTTLNYSYYRELLHKVNPPCIPFIGMYLKDLTFNNDGNTNKLIYDNKQLINFSKQNKTAQIIREIQQYQFISYNFKRVREVENFLKLGIEQAPILNELYAISEKLEPKEREDEKLARLLQESGFL